MYLDLGHTKFEAYVLSIALLKECYKITYTFPIHERYNLSQQIRRASLSIMLNIAEGASRHSPLERKRFYEIARGSVIEVDSAFDAAYSLNYTDQTSTSVAGTIMLSIFKLLSATIKTLS